MRLYNPVDFDPDDVLPPKLRKFGDDARYFIHKIYERKTIKRMGINKFIPLKAKYIRKIISERRYTAIKRILLEEGVIETDARWITGVKCLGFRIGKKYKKSRVEKVEVFNKRLIRNIEKWKPKKKQLKDKHLIHLSKFLHQIELDGSIEEERNLINQISIEMIKSNDFWFSQDEYGRVHTNITNFNAKLRKYLVYQNSKLSNIDITNSQPLFLSILIKKQIQSPIVLYEPLCDIFSAVDFDDELSRYTALCEKGTLYEYLAGDNLLERQEFKKEFFRSVLFGRNNKNYNRTYEIFNSLFPLISGAIRAFKQHDHRRLAWSLQKVESDLVIDGVIKELADKHPDVFITTIHDSFLTTPEHVDLVKGIVYDKFREVGIKPTLKVESYAQQT